ncbi:MAG: hypothetical protein WC333_01170 [Dehalococcoidia bacterium]|jgi:hypothetical protein
MAVTGSTITHIAVISETADDFQVFLSRMGYPIFEHLKGSKKRKVLTANATYYCITKPTDVCSLTVDKVMFTDNAIFNKDLEKIIEYIKPCIRPLWK